MSSKYDRFSSMGLFSDEDDDTHEVNERKSGEQTVNLADCDDELDGDNETIWTNSQESGVTLHTKSQEHFVDLTDDCEEEDGPVVWHPKDDERHFSAHYDNSTSFTNNSSKKSSSSFHYSLGFDWNEDKSLDGELSTDNNRKSGKEEVETTSYSKKHNKSDEERQKLQTKEGKREEKERQRWEKYLQKESQKRDREEKKRKAEENKRRKAEEKEREKQRKEQEKRLTKTKSKEECLEEITVLLDHRFVASTGGGEVLALLQSKKCKTQITTHSLPNVIQWRRTWSYVDHNADSQSQDSVSQDDIDTMETSQSLQVKTETAILDRVFVRLHAVEFVDMVLGEDKKFYSFVKNVRNTYPHCTVMYVLEGMNDYFKNQLKQTNKIMRGQSTQDTLQSFSRQALQKVVIWLQVEAKVHLRQTNHINDTAEYLYRLTSTIACSPYKKESAFSGFCAESVSRSTSLNTAWLNQLTQIHGVSYAVAKCIVSEYPTFGDLLRMYECEGLTERDKQLLLADIKRTTGTKLGEVLSKKIYHVYNELDGTKLVRDL